MNDIRDQPRSFPLENYTERDRSCAVWQSKIFGFSKVPLFALNLILLIIISWTIYQSKTLNITPPIINHPKGISSQKHSVPFLLGIISFLTSVPHSPHFHLLSTFRKQGSPLGPTLTWITDCISLLTGLPASAFDPESEPIKIQDRSVTVLQPTLQDFICFRVKVKVSYRPGPPLYFHWPPLSHSCPYSLPASPTTSWLFLDHAKHTAASRPLYMAISF